MVMFSDLNKLLKLKLAMARNTHAAGQKRG
jgi:hypothetical protein